jgi:hypothetical protein
LAFLGDFLSAFLAFFAMQISFPGQSLGTRASEAKESQSHPLQLLYGCQRQVSRKFRFVEPKSRRWRFDLTSSGDQRGGLEAIWFC